VQHRADSFASRLATEKHADERRPETVAQFHSFTAPRGSLFAQCLQRAHARGEFWRRHEMASLRIEKRASLRGAKRRSNLGGSARSVARDCFASLAM